MPGGNFSVGLLCILQGLVRISFKGSAKNGTKVTRGFDGIFGQLDLELK
jgi:hypothetical protein